MDTMMTPPPARAASAATFVCGRALLERGRRGEGGARGGGGERTRERQRERELTPLGSGQQQWAVSRVVRGGRPSDRHFIAEQPSPVPHLARPEERAALTRAALPRAAQDDSCIGHGFAAQRIRHM